MNKTNYLIILCIAVSALTWLFANDQTIEWLAYSGDNILKGRVWTLFTGLFIHSDPTHLLGNMIFFYNFGNTIEKELNQKWVLLPFFIGGVTSTPRVEVAIPQANISIPVHQTEDVISMDAEFSGLGTAIDATDEATITYVGAP